MILRVRFNKKNYLRYIGHLDLMKLFQRNFSRVGIPIRYSEGFNPKPRLSIANPLSLGIESEEEYMDVDLEDKISVEEFIKKMNSALPEDIQIIDGKYLEKGDSISSLIEWAVYEIRFNLLDSIDKTSFEEIIEKWLLKDEIIITRSRKKGRSKIEQQENIKGFIKEIKLRETQNNAIVMEITIKSGDNGNLRPLDFMEALNGDNNLNIDIDSIMMKRLAMYAEKDGNLYKPF
jgi:radical SAM-linked protein